MHIKNKKEKCRWKDCLTCTCKGKLEKCLHCKYTEAENSVPKENFIFTDKDGNERLVKEVTIHYGKDDDVIGWVY